VENKLSGLRKGDATSAEDMWCLPAVPARPVFRCSLRARIAESAVIQPLQVVPVAPVMSPVLQVDCQRQYVAALTLVWNVNGAECICFCLLAPARVLWLGLYDDGACTIVLRISAELSDDISVGDFGAFDDVSIVHEYHQSKRRGKTESSRSRHHQ
jgi:hypothetical protein